jgi:hypothetical protein
MLNDILSRVDANKAKIDAFRPLEEPLLSQLRAYYRIGLTWSSNALEGNSLTESETKVVLEDGLTVGGKPIRDYYEATGHARAYDAMWGLLPKDIDEELAAIARETLAAAIDSLPARPYIWSEAGKEKYAQDMLKLSAEKLEQHGYDINYGKGYSIEQGYLLDYFSRLYWNEAASKPED